MPNVGGWVPQPTDPRDYTLLSHRPDLVYTGEPLAAAVDLRSQMPPIRDQGDLGSCTAFASLAIFEYINGRRGFIIHDGSELAQYYNARLKSGLPVDRDSGAYNRGALAALGDFGSGAEPTWPYDISRFREKPPAAYYADGARHRAIRYISVPNQQTQIKALLNQPVPIPVVIGFLVYSNYGDAAETGVWPMPGGRVEGGHAVVIAGYDDARGWWIIRNSWGLEWGDGGYGYLPYPYLSSQGSDFWIIEEVSGLAPEPEPEPAPPPPPQPPPEPAVGEHDQFVIDISFHELTEAQAIALKNDARCAGVLQCLWTGREQPPPRVKNLRTLQYVGLPFGCYISLLPGHSGSYDIQMGRSGVPDDLWEQANPVEVDDELEGVIFDQDVEAFAALEALGKSRKIVYTNYNQWVYRKGNPPRRPGWELHNAYWDNDQDLDFSRLPFGNWTMAELVGEQYFGEGWIEGVWCDRNLYRRGVFAPAPEPIPPEPEPEPEPEPPEPTPEPRLTNVRIEGDRLLLAYSDDSLHQYHLEDVTTIIDGAVT